MNPIIKNANFNTQYRRENPIAIIAKEDDFKRIYHVIHEDWKPSIKQAYEEMSKGIDYAFWWKENKIVFEG